MASIPNVPNSGRATFLVLDPEALVRLDLTEALQEICPSAEVHLASSLEHARGILDEVGELTGAIVGVGVPALKRSGIAATLASFGAWIICLNGRRTDYIRAEGWHPLTRPFSSDDAQRLLSSLLESRTSAPAAG